VTKNSSKGHNFQNPKNILLVVVGCGWLHSLYQYTNPKTLFEI